MSKGFVMIPREILKWRWYNNTNTFRIYLHLILSANFTDCGFEGYLIRRGQLATSYESLSRDTGLTVQEARTAIKHLKLTGELTVEKTPKFSIISIKNYNKFQPLTGLTTGDQQGANRVSTGEQQQYNKEIMEECNNNRVSHKGTSMYQQEKLDFDTWANSVLDLFKKICVDFIQPDRLTDHRRRLLYQAQMDGVDFKELFTKAQASDFLSGRKDGNCNIGIDWILKPENRQKIMEGNYKNRDAPKKKDRLHTADGASFDLSEWRGVFDD